MKAQKAACESVTIVHVCLAFYLCVSVWCIYVSAITVAVSSAIVLGPRTEPVILTEPVTSVIASPVACVQAGRKPRQRTRRDGRFCIGA